MPRHRRIASTLLNSSVYTGPNSTPGRDISNIIYTTVLQYPLPETLIAFCSEEISYSENIQRGNKFLRAHYFWTADEEGKGGSLIRISGKILR